MSFISKDKNKSLPTTTPDQNESNALNALIRALVPRRDQSFLQTNPSDTEVEKRQDDLSVVCEKKRILDKSKTILGEKELNEILNEIKKSKFYGDIIWHKEQNRNDIVNKIEAQLINSNLEFMRFPNDKVFCEFCLDVIRPDIRKGGLMAPNLDSSWAVEEVYEFPKEGKQKGLAYKAVIYVNDRDCQVVLCHRSCPPLLTKFDLMKQNQLPELVKDTLYNNLGDQLEPCYQVTKIACDLAKEKGYFLSFTGYSHGAWLAEYSMVFSHKYFDYKGTKAVLFDGPGIIKDETALASNIISKETSLKLKDLNIVNYLTAPNIQNTMNKHIGKVYRVFVVTKYEDKSLNKLFAFINEALRFIEENSKKINIVVGPILSKIE